MFTEHDADHTHDLIEAASTSWRNEVINIPKTAVGVIISASVITPTTDGMIMFAADGATGTIPGGGQDPTIAALNNVLLWASFTGNGGDLKQSSVHGEIPITIPATPAISYVSNQGLTGNTFFMIVRGYRDVFTPRV